MRPAVAYARYSSSNQREESIAAQLRAIEDYAQREGYKLMEIFTDEARSATTDDRPGFQDMIDRASDGSFDAVIVHKLDRFSRDRFDSIKYKRILQMADTKLLSVTERLDDSPESVMLESVLQGMAEYYSKNLSREVKKGLLENAHQCKFNGGFVPLGYSVDEDNFYIVNEKEAPAIKLIFEWYAEDKGYSAIIKELNRRGYKTRRGKPFGKNSIFAILRNEKYKGTYTYNRLKTKQHGQRVRLERPEKEVVRIEGGIPAIVSTETWDLAQAKKITRARVGGSMKKESREYLLTGKIYCGECGAAMNGRASNNGYKDYLYYECSGRRRLGTCDKKQISADLLDQMVLDRIHEDLVSVDIIEETTDFVYGEMVKLKKDAPSDIKELEKQLWEVENQISRYLDLIEKGNFNDSMMERFNQLDQQKGYLKKLLSKAIKAQEDYTFTREEVRLFLLQFTKIKEMSPKVQKKALETLLYRVTAYHHKTEIAVVTQTSSAGVGVLLVPAGRHVQHSHEVLLYLALYNYLEEGI